MARQMTFMASPWQNKEVLEREYVEKSKSSTEVAETLGCSRATVLRWLDRHDIETDPKHGFADERLRDPEKMQELYENRGLSAAKIGEKFGCSGSAVLTWLDKHDIETRKAGGMHQTPSKLRNAEWLSTQYEEKSKSHHEIADEVGCHTNAVRRWLKRHGCELQEQGFPEGEEHPRWKETTWGIYGSNWDAQREKALERDNWQCRRCGINNQEHKEQYDNSLHVHHITPRAEYESVEDSNEIDNLITLCARCHRMLEGIPIDNR